MLSCTEPVSAEDNHHITRLRMPTFQCSFCVTIIIIIVVVVVVVTDRFYVALLSRAVNGLLSRVVNGLLSRVVNGLLSRAVNRLQLVLKQSHRYAASFFVLEDMHTAWHTG